MWASFASKANGSAFVASGYTWIISYTGGGGNDVTLTVATPQQAWRFTYFATIANTGTVGVTEQILTNNGTVQTVKTTIPAGAGGNRFVHLSVAR